MNGYFTIKPWNVLLSAETRDHIYDIEAGLNYTRFSVDYHRVENLPKTKVTKELLMLLRENESAIIKYLESEHTNNDWWELKNTLEIAFMEAI